MNRTEIPPTTKGPVPPDMIVLGFFLSIISLGTVGGNTLVILAVGLVKKLRTPSNFLIVSLALSDLLVGLLVIPFATFVELVKSWTLGEVLCDMYISFDVLLCTASILNLCAISIDRYLAITKPLQYAAKRTPKRMLLMVSGVWVASTLISIPPIFGFKKEFKPGECNYSTNVIYQIYATCGAFYIPLMVMVFLYGRIFVLARRMAQEDAKQKRVTDSVAAQTTPSIPEHAAEHLLDENGNVANQAPNGFEPIVMNHSVLDLPKIPAPTSERYPLPPSELCRRRRPRPLYTISYQNCKADSTSNLLQRPDIDVIPGSPSGLSHTEEFEERVKNLRQLRDEFFHAPPSRHCSSVILNFRPSIDSTDMPLIDLSTLRNDQHLGYTERTKPNLRQSYSLREDTHNSSRNGDMYTEKAKQQLPMLSVSYYADDQNTTNGSQGCESTILHNPSDVYKERSHRAASLTTPQITVDSGTPAPTLDKQLQPLRPRPRPLHTTGRRSLVNASDFQSGRDCSGRCSLLTVRRNSKSRRLSSPNPSEHVSIMPEAVTWSNNNTRPSGDVGYNHHHQVIQRSTSRLFNRNSDHALGQPRSRTASFASVRIAAKKRKPRGHSETKAIKTLGVIMGCFCLCWVPFFIIAVARPLHKVVTGFALPVPPAVESLFLWLGYINSTINPVIYAIFNREFRIPFKEILMCRCRGINARLRSKRYATEFGIPPSNLSVIGAGGAGQTSIMAENGMDSNTGPTSLGRRRSQLVYRNTSDAGFMHDNHARPKSDALELPVSMLGRRSSHLMIR